MKLLRHYNTLFFTLYIALIILHFLIKDDVFPLSIIYYMTPLPIIIVTGLCLLFILKKNKKTLTAIIVIVLTIFWLINYLKFNHSEFSVDAKQLLFWNIADQKFLPKPFLEEKIASYKPDIIAFVETKKISVSDLKYLHTYLKGYDIRVLKGYMIIAVKGEIIATDFTYLTSNTKFNHVTYSIHKEKQSLVIADVSANPFQNRKNDLKTILAFSNDNHVDMIIGDFNTPFESIHFKNYSDRYSSFHDVTDGFTATWPYRIPLLELDQFWVSNTYKPIHLEKSYSTSSDHAMLLGSYIVATKPY